MSTRRKRYEWRPVTLALLCRAVALGWNWLSDPRKGGQPAIRSPAGRVYDFQAWRVRERYDEILKVD